MQELKLSIMTLDDGHSLELSPVNDETYQMFGALLSNFGEVDNGVLKVKSEQRATLELKNKVSRFVEANSGAFPILNRLKSKIEKIPDNQFFLLLHKLPSDAREKLHYELYLSALNSDDENNVHELFESNLRTLNGIVGDLFEHYDFHQPRTDRRVIIGNAKKDFRRCRFCGETQKDGAKFKKTAHAIPEALGNKNIILADECDECNGFFGDEIEPNLIQYLDIYRVFLGAKGKDGAPTILYENGRVFHKDGAIVVESKNIDGNPEQGFSVQFNSSKKVTPIKLYKALCKITLSTLDEQVLADLKETINWVRYGGNPLKAVPKIAVNVEHKGFSKTPQIANYVRKSEFIHLPHIVSEFRIGSYVYVYILPFSDKDELEFLIEPEVQGYWSQFKHYNQFPGWHFLDLSSTSEVILNEKIRMVPRMVLSD